MNKKSSRFAGAKAVKEMQSGETQKPVKEGIVRFKNPDYQQTTVYLRRDTHKALKIALAQDERGFADLVEELIEQWLKARKV